MEGGGQLQALLGFLFARLGLQADIRNLARGVSQGVGELAGRLCYLLHLSAS